MYPKGSESYGSMQNHRETVSKAVGVGSNPTSRASKGDKMKHYNIYTDGGCRNNGKENALAAWSFVIVNDNNNHILDHKSNIILKDPTNIRAEMLAIINALN